MYQGKGIFVHNVVPRDGTPLILDKLDLGATSLRASSISQHRCLALVAPRTEFVQDQIKSISENASTGD
jgi:hypothetical protein